jgi:tetratricopeptide (TPR) repeat protein
MKLTKQDPIGIMIDQLDLQIKAGRINTVRTKLLSLNRADFDIKYYFDIANLARRVQLPYYVLSWLSSLVRPVNTLLAPNTDTKLIALYANALSRIGAFQEAEDLFTTLDAKADPQILFFQALLEMQRWENERAEEYLRKYIVAPELSDYQIKIAKLNLASIIGLNGLDEGITLTQEIILTSSKNSLLIANALEVQGQMYFHLKSYNKAQVALTKAYEIFQKNNSPYSYYIEKWALLNKLFQKKSLTHDDLTALDQFRQRANQDFQWEVVRDCDYFKALLTNDQDSLMHIYFGTRFESYRRRILDHCTLNLKLHKEFNLYLSYPNDQSPRPLAGSLQKSDFMVDSLSGWCPVSKRQFSEGLPLKLFQLLTTDIYRPFHLGEIFHWLYGGEYFNPNSSPQKISRIIQRLRDNFKDIDAPIAVKIYQKQVYLAFKQPVVLIKHQHQQLKKVRYQEEIYKIKIAFINKSFRSRDVERLLNISLRTAKRILKTLVENQCLSIKKAGRSTRYFVIAAKIDTLAG